MFVLGKVGFGGLTWRDWARWSDECGLTWRIGQECLTQRDWPGGFGPEVLTWQGGLNRQEDLACRIDLEGLTSSIGQEGLTWREWPRGFEVEGEAPPIWTPPCSLRNAVQPRAHWAKGMADTDGQKSLPRWRAQKHSQGG